MDIKGVKKVEVKGTVQLIKNIFFEYELGHVEAMEALRLIKTEFFRLCKLLKMF